MKFLELKNITELRKIVDGINWIFGPAQERIGELENRSEESIQTEAWRGKKEWEVKGILGRQRSRKHQETVSLPRQQLPWQDLSNVINLKHY